MKQRLLITLLFVTGLIASPRPPTAVSAPPDAPAIAAPQLKWQHGGCDSSWCERGWYASPAVADLDGDGKPEVLASAYSLFALNGEDGSVQWQVDPPGDRTWPGVVAADLDADNDWEVVVAQGNGHVTTYDHTGQQIWSMQPQDSELRGLSAYDLDDDGTLELAVTGTGDGVNTWVLAHTGSIRAGWPQLSNDSGYAWGAYNDNAALGDLDSDGQGELVVPSDVHYINAYEADGSQIAANPIYGGDGWGRVGIWESLDVELRGWGRCNGVRAESYRTNFADGPAVIADVNGDGVHEVVVTGNVYDCNAGYPPSRYVGVYIFNADRSRFKADGFNWETVPIDTGAPLSEDFTVIESAMPNPVVADLDGDGLQEILFASYDGRLHAFWLDKTERYQWPYDVSATGAGIRFATEPVVADLDGDGQAEVIFASWPQKTDGYVGKLHILNYRGEPIHELALPAPKGGSGWNGVLAAPTLANIDADADLELVLNSTNAGVLAYDLPGTTGARLLWATGRGNYQRSGSNLTGSLAGSTVHLTPAAPASAETVTITIRLVNPGPALAAVALTHLVPDGLTYANALTASTGSASYDGSAISWEGDAAAGAPVTVSYQAMVAASQPMPVVAVVTVDEGTGVIRELSTTVIVNPWLTYLPVLLRP